MKWRRRPAGTEGLGRLVDEKFDCVLVDLQMAEMDGMEVCRRIAAMRQSLNSGVPSSYVTGSAQPGDLNRALEAGADDFVSKSGDLAVLRARIQALMRRRFFQEESGRIVEELKAKELETSHARAEREIADSAVRDGRKAGPGQSRSGRGQPETQGNPDPTDPERKDGFAGATGGRNRS